MRSRGFNYVKDEVKINSEVMLIKESLESCNRVKTMLKTQLDKIQYKIDNYENYLEKTRILLRKNEKDREWLKKTEVVSVDFGENTNLKMFKVLAQTN